MKNQNAKPSCVGQFNTLAQKETAINKNNTILITGKGSELSKTKALKGRAKRKMITQKMVLSLIDISNKKHTSERIKPYWNTFHCQSKIYTANGKLHGKYCKNRFCTLCSSIRKAEIINKYYPLIQQWEDPHFVTLTIKAQPLRNLNKFMKGMIIAFNRITDKYRKRNQRNKGIKLVGIKSLECNFNASKRTYNPHFHLVVRNEEIANILINEWLKIWTPKYANILGQHKMRVDDRKKILIEIIKYGSKIFTEPDLKEKLKGSKKHKIYAAALNNIFNSMQGLRIFERFGFNLPITINDSNTAIVKLFDEWIFDLSCFDWVNTNTGELLTNYNPPFELTFLLDNCIESILE